MREVRRALEHGAETVGIAAIACYVPPASVSAEEIAAAAGLPPEVLTEKIGMRRKPMAARAEQPSAMALTAARDALRRAGLQARDLDFIVYAGSAPQDYLLWSAASKLQHSLRAERAFAFELAQGCNVMNLGVHLARELLLGDARLQHALVASADKYSAFLDYTRPQDLSLFHLADAAGAVLLRRGEPTNRLLAYAQITDGSFADHVSIRIGGTAEPCGPDAGRQVFSVHDRAELDHLLSEVYLRNYLSVIRTALARSGRAAEEVDFLFTNQVKASTMAAILDALRIPATKTLRSLEDHGHMAAIDTVFALGRCLDQGRIQPGDLVVLASSAVGFSWAALVLQF